MTINCPKCNTQIDNNNINVQENIGVCQSCNQLFKLSEILAAQNEGSENEMERLSQESINEIEKMLYNPPKDAFVKKDSGIERIGVFTRSKSAFFLIFFSLLFSCVSLFILFQAVLMNVIPVIMFVFAFLILSVFLWVRSFYAIFGKIELVMKKNETDYIFTGIGTAGKKRFINWTSIKNITEHTIQNSQGTHNRHILIDGEKQIKIPTDVINKNKIEFLINILKYYKERKIRFQQFL